MMRQAMGNIAQARGRGGAGALALGALLVAVMALLAAALPARAAVERAKAEAFLHVTGFDVALDSIALSAKDAPMMLGMKAEEFGLQWTQAAKEVFDPKRMREMALDILEPALDEELLSHATDFYASALGQRLVAAENASHMVEDDAARRQQGEELLSAMQADNPARVTLLKEMNEAVDSEGLGARAAVELQLRFLMAASDAGVIDLKLNEPALRAMLSKDADELKERLETSALQSSAYTYRDFSDAELKKYDAALRDPRMQKVYQLMNAIQWEVMANRFEAIAVRMAGMDRGEEL
jgi:hypothetical protein